MAEKITVRELIAKLRSHNQDAVVRAHFKGEDRDFTLAFGDPEGTVLPLHEGNAPFVYIHVAHDDDIWLGQQRET